MITSADRPKLLIASDKFKDVFVEAELLYGLMSDRLSLSIKNGGLIHTAGRTSMQKLVHHVMNSMLLMFGSLTTFVFIRGYSLKESINTLSNDIK